ncbi:MAG TPA: hypothetical protein PKX55_25235, partial [Leptospiraceae bacterium]|nr:hypothetical protein [Leptospiraceae bacterium]
MKQFYVIFILIFISSNNLLAQANCEKFESLKKAFMDNKKESVCELDLRNQHLKSLPTNMGDLINLEILH